MFRLWAVALMVVAFPVGAASDDEWMQKRLPAEYWEYMNGYKYQYSESCTVGWNMRMATFRVPASCPELSFEKLNSDALKSIEYVKSRSDAADFWHYYEEAEAAQPKPTQKAIYSLGQAKVDARELWRRACVNAKSFQRAPFIEMADEYPKIDRLHAGRLFANASDTVKGTGGMVNCAEQAQYVVDVYTSDVDIRAR